VNKDQVKRGKSDNSLYSDYSQVVHNCCIIQRTTARKRT